MIKKGIVNDLNEKTITIDNKSYLIPFNTTGILFDKIEYCLLNLNYDGCDIFKGNELSKDFSVDLFRIDCK